MTKVEIIRSKIMDVKDLCRRVTGWKKFGNRVVFTNGCFDIFHAGHIHLLHVAADCGSKLVIGLNSDNSVQRLKGAGRPVNDQASRAMVLASLAFVDGVTLFDEDTPYELIRQVQPDVLVKGGDYNAGDIVGADIVAQWGGEVKVVPLLDGFSTTNIESKIRDNK